MNTDTGQIYTEPIEIQAAEKRGEPIVKVSRRTARFDRKRRMQIGQAINNLKRTKPNLSDDEREALAIKVTANR